MSEAKPGWYPDPSGDTSKLRFWDGTAWTDQYMDAPAAPHYSSDPANDSVADNSGAETVIYQTAYANQPSTSTLSSTDSTLRLIAFILNVLTVISFAVLIIPLAWMIPMTVRSWGIYKGTKPNTVAFGVCTLIFLDLVSGILLLCSTKDE